MQFLAELWLPILVSAALVFVASSVIHMLLPFHKKDYRGLADEDGVMEAVRRANPTVGQYFFPHAPDMKSLGDPAMIERFTRGPVGILTIRPSGPPNMGPSLIQWFVFSILVSVFAAYLAALNLGPAPEYLAVFRLTGTVAFTAYGLGAVPDSIWKGVPWSTTVKNVVDGLVYALLTAGVFAWLY